MSEAFVTSSHEDLDVAMAYERSRAELGAARAAFLQGGMTRALAASYVRAMARSSAAADRFHRLFPDEIERRSLALCAQRVLRNEEVRVRLQLAISKFPSRAA